VHRFIEAKCPKNGEKYARLVEKLNWHANSLDLNP
jgi:hypothetical protein